MKKHTCFLLILFSASFLFGCSDNDPLTPTPVQQTPDPDDEQAPGDNAQDSDDEDTDGDDDPVPVKEFKLKVEGKEFTCKILKARYFTADEVIDIEAHEVDDTFEDQRVLGFQVDLKKIESPGDYDLEKLDPSDVIIYMFDEEGKSYQNPRGIISIKKISSTRIEFTFSSITLISGFADVEPITFTNGSISLDLVEEE